MANIFIENFDFIKKGANFEKLLGEYKINLHDKYMCFSDYVNFAKDVLDIDVTINLTSEEYITYNIIDNIINVSTVYDEKVKKTNFFNNNFSDIDMKSFIKNLEDFYALRGDIDLDSFTLDDYINMDLYDDVHDKIDNYLVTLKSKYPLIDETNVVSVYKKFIKKSEGFFQEVDSEVEKIFSNPKIFPIVKKDYNEVDYIDYFLYDLLGCTPFRPRRRGKTALITQVPSIDSFYIYDFRNDKIVFDCSSEEEMLKSLKKLF